MREWLTGIDTAVLDWIHGSLGSSAMDAFMSAITHLADSVLIFMAFGFILMISPKYRKYGAAIILSSILCYLIGNLGIKPLVGRMRPFETNPSIVLLIDPPRGYSFPSGHAMSSFAWAAVLCRAPIRAGLKALPVALASIISLSRLYLYVHYPSDVIVGALLGILIGLLSIWLTERVKKVIEDRSEHLKT